MSAKRTVMEVFEETAKKYSSQPAMKVKLNCNWQTTTWADYLTQVRAERK